MRSSCALIARRWLPACFLWLMLSISLGWYYTFTYYGRAGWPMPTMEACLALVLYYFSVLNVTTEVQAIHWVIVFPLAGILWALALWLTAPRFAARKAAFSELLPALALSSLPLTLPVFWMAWIAGQTGQGFLWEQMMRVALRRAGVTPWEWLSPLYFALGLVSLVTQIIVYRWSFTARGRIAWFHFFASATAATVAACVMAVAAALPLRAWLE